jgi:hypothetical protein
MATAMDERATCCREIVALVIENANPRELGNEDEDKNLHGRLETAVGLLF